MPLYNDDNDNNSNDDYNGDDNRLSPQWCWCSHQVFFINKGYYNHDNNNAIQCSAHTGLSVKQMVLFTTN